MTIDLHRLFSRRGKSRSSSRSHQRREHYGVEPLEIRRAFATYQLDGFSFAGEPVTGWPVIGAGDLTLHFDSAFDSTSTLALQFSNGTGDVQVNLDTTSGSANAVAVIPPGIFQPIWDGTAFNATLSIVGDTLTGNTTLPINPSNIASISPDPLTVNASANLTLVATDPEHGFANLSTHNFFLVGGPNDTVSPSLVGTATNATHLTISVPAGVLDAAGDYTLYTTPSGAAPANAAAAVNSGLIGNLNVSVQSLNYTIASITYQDQAITGWSFFGSGADTINITLAAGSTPFSVPTTVHFTDNADQNVSATVTNLTPAAGNMTLHVPVPYWGSFNGTTATTTISFGPSANDDTTNGSFQFHGVDLLSLSTTQGYLSGGGNLTLTANSAVFGFGNQVPVTVNFFEGSTHTPVTANATSSTELTVVLPTFPSTGNYSVFIGSPTNTSVPASNNLSFDVLPNPVLANLTITFQDNTGLATNGSPSSTTPPGINDFYLYVYGQIDESQGFLHIDPATGLVGTTPAGSANGVLFTSLNNATLFFDLTGGAYAGTRIYLSTESVMQNQPTANFAAAYYDFLEIAASNTSVFADTSQVDQFGIPLTLNLSLVGSNQSSTSGISDGLSRQDILTGYHTYFHNEPGYNLAIVPSAGLGNAALSTYRVLAPNDLLNAITAEGSAFQQANSTTFSISPQSGSHDGYAHWAYLNITTANSSINGTLYPAGSFVTGPWIPAGTVIAETNPSNTATSFIIATNQTIADASPFQNATIDGNIATAVGGVRIQQVTSDMTSDGYQALINAFGPSVYNYANGTAVPWDNVTLNQNNAIDLMFTRYKDDFWWQEENQPAETLSNTTLYPQQVALYRGSVTTTTAESIEGTNATYSVLRFIDYSDGSANPNLTLDIYYPYFTTNSPAGKVDPFGNPVPAPPAWFGQSEGNFKAVSLQVFGGAQIFQPGGNSTSGDSVALNDLGRDVAVAISRGYASTMLATGEPINNASSPNLPVFQFTGAENTSGTWTMPTSVFQTANPEGENITGWVASSFLNFGSPMTITGVTTVGGNTVIDVVSYVSGQPIVIAEGKNRDNLQFVFFADDASVYPNGAGPIPYNKYESFIQSRGDFAQGVSDGHGFEKVNINGLGYGYAFSDFMGLSSTISVNALTTADAPANQSAQLIVTMQPWFNSAPIDVTYDIESVMFESQVISGWSLFGSGTDQITITTTGNSTPFNQNATYGLAFGGVNATGMAVGSNALTVSVPSLVSLWEGEGSSSFANLAFMNPNATTTGDTTFSVLPVNLATVAPGEGAVSGNTALTLTATDKQHGFGNATNLSGFFHRSGVTAGATNVTVINATTVTLTTPAVGEPGNWTLGIYKADAATSANLASNNLAFTYTESSLVFLSGDFNADGLTDIATLLDNGYWEVSFTQPGGNATLVSLDALNYWTTDVTWVDWSVLRSGDRDVIVARAEVPNEAGSWWKLSYDGAANGTSATDFSTNFVGSWDFSGAGQWIDVVNGDFDGDGNMDIIGRNSTNNQWWMLANATQNANLANYDSKNVYMGAWSSEVQWDQTLAGNFLGDPSGKAQVAGLTGSTWWLSEYEGTPGSMNHTVMTTQWGQHENFTDYRVGNFDGVPGGPDLIAAKTENNAWYSLGYNASITPQNNTPSLMGLWPDHTSTYSDVLVGDFFGSGNGTVGIAGLQRSNGNLSWWVLERGPGGGSYDVRNFGSWPQSTLAQAFAGLYSDSDVASGRTGILGRKQQNGVQVWDRGASNGTAFAVAPVTGYPS